MDNLRAVIKNLFCNISPQEILEGHTKYNSLSEATFMKLGSGYITRYSNDELHNMYYFLDGEFEWQNCKLRDETPKVMLSKTVELNVFDALLAFDNAVLIEENGVPMCQYAQLLRWREMIVALEEDLFITSFLAFKDGSGKPRRERFFWKPVIGHNNRALNCLVEKGVAENHFHLKGSAPQFHLSWISIMNRVDDRKIEETLNEYEGNRLQKKLAYDKEFSISELSHMWRQAALIRLFLFSILKGTYLDLDPYEEETTETGNSQRVIDLRQRHTERIVKRILNDPKELKDYAGRIQNGIEAMNEAYGKSALDYTICETYLLENKANHTNELLSGERWFMYSMFSGIFNQDSPICSYTDWFYLYLVLKNNIRQELVQANSNVGFDNFLLYQDRKDAFIDDTDYEKIYVRMAVKDTIYNQHINSLEARITPKETVRQNLDTIRKYDKWIQKDLTEEQAKDLEDKYFYVYHFVKESERWTPEKFKNPLLQECRHAKKRKEIESKARAIAGMREGGTKEAARVRGIDACSPEIWCRPEVFAQAFRFLKQHSVWDCDAKYADTAMPHLMATYHVGEDFLDITDGLRAIDEAISFLDLRCGDRIGHALALGVDIDEWYAGKSNRILINKLGYLDNLVWLYSKVRKYKVPDSEGAKAYIEKRFYEYFQEIFRNNFVDWEIEDIIQKAKKYYDGCGIKHGYNHRDLSFGINEYYDAWKLRGDNPALYKEGFFCVRGSIFDEWDKYAVNKSFPLNYKIRYNPETAFLYYMYHFNPYVKLIGDQMIEVRVNPVLKDALKKVQKIMQREISRIGLGIETNPSSNYQIGTFRRYDKHPITSWYNCGLTSNPQELEECPQMQVSINTDDQGVFATYIENEYAYLALAMEKCVDEKGQKKYNRTMILRWLENIRNMGIDQSFGNVKIEKNIG